MSGREQFTLDGIAPQDKDSGSHRPITGKPRLVYVDRSQLCWHMVDVERLVEEDHPARAIWELVGQLDLSQFIAVIRSFEGEAGRAAYDPALLVSLWIYAYSRGIGSAREIERRCGYEPAFQWLTGLEVINHHTLSDFRVGHREALDELFTQVLAWLSAEGLIGLERVMHDGTKIAADAGPNSFRREETIQKHLDAAREQLEAMGKPDEEAPVSRRDAAQKRARREREERFSRALTEVQKIQSAKTPRASKQQAGASTTDPDARVMKQHRGSFSLSYNVQISTDAQAGIAVGVSASQTAPDYEHLVPAVEQIEQRLKRRPKQLIVDAGYSSRQNILDMHTRNIEMVGPWIETDGRVKQRFERCGVTEAFMPDKFRYVEESNTYVCPEGKTLHARKGESRPGRTLIRYQTRQQDCWSCQSRKKCCSGNTRYGRSIVVTQEDPVVSAFRQRAEHPDTKDLLRERGQVGEFPNAWIKEKLGLRRFHVRGLAKVDTEAMWAVLTYDIQQWIRLRWRPRVGLVT